MSLLPRRPATSDAATSQLPGAADFCLLVGVRSITPCSHQLLDEHKLEEGLSQAISPALLLSIL